jgi:hypothetical protein
VPETCRELKNRINKSIKSGASSWFSARNIARCMGNKTLKIVFLHVHVISNLLESDKMF